MKLKRVSGKGLGGKPPRRPRGRPRDGRRPETTRSGGLLPVLALAFFCVGLAGGYGWGLDRQIRGGILTQRAEEQRRPDWVPLNELPAYVPDAFVAVVEPTLLRRGALRPAEHGTTLARELVHQVHLLPNSVPGEAEEMLMGPVLARRLPPQSLVELFLNRAAIGRDQGVPVYGIWHAAQEYFGKDPRQLTLGETATLAGLLLQPRVLDPRSNIGAVGERRNEVLRVMLMGGVIDESAYATALTEPLGVQPGLEQIPMSRPPDWGRPSQPLRLPPNLRPQPTDSTSNLSAEG